MGRAILLAEAEGVEDILPHHLPKDVQTPQADSLPFVDATDSASPNVPECFVLPFPMGTTLKEIEKSAILTTLVRENGNRSKTAAVLGISRGTLRAKLSAYNE